MAVELDVEARVAALVEAHRPQLAELVRQRSTVSRLLVARSKAGYTDNRYKAMREEPEAVSATDLCCGGSACGSPD